MRAKYMGRYGAVLAASLLWGAAATAQPTAATPPATQPTAGSLIEDRAAQKLLAAGDSRIELDQVREGLELYQQVIERYPRSPVRFEAFVRLGKHHLHKSRDPLKALPYFERAADAANESPALRGEAMLMLGRCHYEMQKYPQAFAALRAVIQAYPGTEFSNQAYFYIGSAHYKLGAYNRAIEAFSKVGTAISDTEQGKKQIEISKRLFVRLADIDLLSLGEGALITTQVSAASGDSETVRLVRVGTATSSNYLGEIDTTLGKATPGDGILQLRGDDTVTIIYIDAQTADRKLNVARVQTLKVVSNAIADFMDGAFRDPLKNVVVGKQAYVRVIDYDRDLSASADTVDVKIIAKRPIRRAEATTEPVTALTGEEPTTQPTAYQQIDELKLTLTERPRSAASHAAVSATAEPQPIHSGVFGGQVPVLAGEPVAGDAMLQVQVGDVLEVIYIDQVNASGKPAEVKAAAQTVHGSLGEVRVANQDIRDQQLELQTRLKKAEALTNIGRLYKQLGLDEQAARHFRAGVEECESLAAKAKNLGGEVLETMYVRLWNLYIELDELDKAAAMCLALQREFPNSQFVDEALLGLGQTAMKKGEHDKAIAVFKRVLDLPTSQRKADALYSIGLCQEAMAAPKSPTDKPNQQMMEAAFVSFQTAFDRYPTSGVAGDAVGKMADFFMARKEYDRAVTTFQRALDDYPDAQFTDRVLYDYGRCLYRMQRPAEALARFRQLMSEYPQSKLSGKARQIVAALEKKAASDE